MDSKAFLPLLALAACQADPEETATIAFEGRSELAPSDPEIAVETAASVTALDGRYGASAADCDSDNRYMTEYVEIDGATFSYRGIERGIAVVREDAITLRGGEELARRGNDLVRWPDQRRKRTVYTRCP